MSLLNERRSILFLLLAILYVVLFVLRADGGFPLDDSWIHQSYGRNLGTSGEWALIPGQPSAASTAPLYTVLLALGYALRLPFMLWTHLLGVLALWGTAAFTARLGDRIAPDLRYNGLLAGVLVVSTWQLVWAGASGMETALFAMWAMLLPLLAWRETDAERSRTTSALLQRGFIFGGVAALAMLTRPEGIGIAGLSGLALLVAIPGGIRAVLMWVAGAVVGFMLFAAPYFWLNLALTGGLLPNTSAAKQVQHEPLLALSYPTRLWRMFQPLWIGGQIFLIPGIVGFVLYARRQRTRATALWWVLPLWVIVLVALYAARLPASYQHGRYVMPALPALVTVGAVGTRWLLHVGQRVRLGRVFSQALLLATLAMFGAMVLGVTPAIYARDVAIINEEMVAAAAWIDTNVPQDALLAIHDIGAVAYFTPRPILDIAGLVSPDVIPYINDAEGMWELLQERNARYLMAFPDQIPGDNPNDPRLCEVFRTGGPTAAELGAANMTVYALAWDGACP